MIAVKFKNLQQSPDYLALRASVQGTQTILLVAGVVGGSWMLGAVPEADHSAIAQAMSSTEQDTLYGLLK